MHATRRLLVVGCQRWGRLAGQMHAQGVNLIAGETQNLRITVEEVSKLDGQCRLSSLQKCVKHTLKL